MKRLTLICLIFLILFACSSVIRNSDTDYDLSETDPPKEKHIEKLLGQIAALYIFTRVLSK